MINGFTINGAPVNGSASGVKTEEVFETAVITGNHTLPITRGLVVRDTATITDSQTVDRTANLLVRDSFVAHDDYAAARIVALTYRDTAVITDNYVLSNPREDVREVAAFNDTAYLSTTRKQTVRETAVIRDNVILGTSLVVRDTAVITDDHTLHHTARLVVQESAVITGTPTFGLAPSRTLIVRDTAVITDTVTTRLTARLVVHEEAFFSDNVFLSGGAVGDSGFPVDAVWTTSVYSWGMSRHSDVGITQRGTRFAVSPSGLYEIGTSYSDAVVETGELDLGSKMLKRVSTVYFQGEHDGTMTLNVTADYNGAQVTNLYTPKARANDDPRSTRFSVGMGYHSTYYKLEVRTTGRVELFGGKLLKGTSKERRI